MKNEIIEVNLAEYKSLSEEIVAIEGHVLRMLTIYFAALIAGAGFAARELLKSEDIISVMNNELSVSILLLVPIINGAVVISMWSFNHGIGALGSYITNELAPRLSELCGEPVLTWGISNYRRGLNSLIHKINGVLRFLIVTFLSGLILVYTNNIIKDDWGLATIFYWIGMIITLGYIVLIVTDVIISKLKDHKLS